MLFLGPRRTRAAAVVLSLAAALLLAIAAPAALATNHHGPRAAQKHKTKKARPFALAAVGTCQLGQQTPFPLELNAVTDDPLVKWIGMEKEIFRCQEAPGSPNLIDRTVQTYIEDQDVANAANVTTLPSRVVVDTCDQQLSTAHLACASKTITPVATSTPLEGCTGQSTQVPQPADPVEMESRKIGNFIVTYKLEKHILDCNDNLGDLYVITRLIEQKSDPGYKFVGVRHRLILCFKQVAAGTITRCVTAGAVPLT